MLETQLTALEASGLIRLAQLEPEQEYWFRHALIQDAAYESVLKADRRKLHEAVGAVLEKLYADRLDEIAPVLGQHFELAGDDAQALRYYSLAGQNAARQFASPEAITHYTHGIRAADRLNENAARLYRERGLAHETLGHFDLARADHEQALALAAHDPMGEWQALIDLGSLWAERDYVRTGDYFQRAYALAQTLDDPTIKARTLNRLGNWHMNIEQPVEARRYQEQALAIFESLNDQRGLAETTDLLGMTNLLSCDLVQSNYYLTRALPLFEALGDRQGLSSSLGTLGASGPNYQVDTMVAVESLPQARKRAQDAYTLAQAMGWPAAEAYACFSIAHNAIAQGDFDDGYQAATNGVAVARSIAHLQWLTASQITLGLWYREAGDLLEARAVFEQALAWAKETGSLHWLRCVGGFLGDVYISLGEFELATHVLRPISDAGAAALTLGHRLVWHALADLALAQGDAQEALRLADWLEGSLPNRQLGLPKVLRLSRLRARAFLHLGETAQAEALVKQALPVADELDARPTSLRLYKLLEKILRAQKKEAEADVARQQAQGLATLLAANISDALMRDKFSATSGH